MGRVVNAKNVSLGKVKTENGEKLVQRIVSNRHIDLPDFSYATPKSVAVATATPHSFALHMRKSFCVNIADI